MDMREQIREDIGEHGFPVLVIRADRRVRCYCWDDLKGSARVDCPTCLGTGWANEVVRKKTIETVESVPETLAGMNRIPDYGSIAIASRAFRFDADELFQRGDIVVLTQFDTSGRPVSALMTFCVISHVTYHYGPNGELVMQTAYAREDPRENPYRSMVLRRMRSVEIQGSYMTTPWGVELGIPAPKTYGKSVDTYRYFAVVEGDR